MEKLFDFTDNISYYYLIHHSFIHQKSGLMPSRQFILLLVCLFLFTIFSQSLTADELKHPATWTVQEAVHFALVNSPNVKIAEQRIEAAHASIIEARSSFYPQLGVSAGYGRTNNPMYSFGNILNQGVFSNTIDFNNPGLTDNLNLTAQLQYRLYNGGRDQAGLEAAQAGEKASRLQRDVVLSQLAFAVVHSFCTIVQAEENVQARKSAIETIDASLTVALARYDAGDLLKADLLNLEVQKSRARENLIQTRHGRDIARRSFLNLLGLEQGDVNIDAAQRCEQVVPPGPSLDKRPEIKQLNAIIRAARAEVRRAGGGYYPTADAFGSCQVDKGFELEDGSGTSWIAGIKVNYNLFAGNRTSAAISRAKAQLAEAKEQKRKMELAINLEVEQATLGLQQAEERMQVTEKMIDLARESARLSRERFKQGLILSSDLIDTENRLTDALVRHSLARASRRIAVADLRRAVGLQQFSGMEKTE